MTTHPINITHLSQDDLDNNRIYHVDNDDINVLRNITSLLSETTPTSGSLFAFGSGGYLSVTQDGKNLVYINIDGATAQITNFS